MRIIVWHGSNVEAEYEYPDAGGPDLHIDPYLRVLHSRDRDMTRTVPTPVPYSDEEGRALQIPEDGVMHLKPGPRHG